MKVVQEEMSSSLFVATGSCMKPQDVKETNQFSVVPAMWNRSKYTAEVMREKFLNASLSATSYLNA